MLLLMQSLLFMRAHSRTHTEFNLFFRFKIKIRLK